MEALRNHVQHNALPAHGFCGSTPKGPNDWVVAVSVRAFKTTLAEDPKFKPRVLAEMGDFVDLRDCARTYVRSLSTVHIGLRTMLTKVFEEARSLIETWTHRYREEGNDSALGLAAIRSVNGTRDASSIPLLLDWDDVRAALSRVNSAPIQFDR